MIQEKFLETIREYRLLNPQDRVVVAVSGGADSVALLHLLNFYREKYGLTLHLAHLNHLIRKHDAELDLRFVENLAGNLNVPVTAESIDVPQYAKEKGLSLEVAARTIRYDFFERVRQAVGADKIAVGHTADDNVETYLMRLLRGSGLKGLCGIPPKRDNIIRPLVKIWRKEIELYVGRLKLVPRRDYTNYESKYLRNRVRMKLIPQLKLYNLNIKEIILQTILLLTDDSLYLDKKADEALAEILLQADEEKAELATGALKKLDDSIQRQLVRKAIEKIKGNLQDLSYKHVCDLLDSLDKEGKWELHLPAGIYVGGNKEKIVIARGKPEKNEAQAYSYTMSVPGELELKELGKTVRATLVEEIDSEQLISDDPQTVFVDFASIGSEVIVRNKALGDRFHPLGMNGSKKLQDLFVDEKIPLERRDQVPIVESDGNIVWVGGVRLDERAKVTTQTSKVVKLELI